MTAMAKHPSAGRPVAMGVNGMVVSAHSLASAAGLGVLADGGNAFDAAVTIGSTLAVVEPHMSGVGGIGVAVGGAVRFILTPTNWPESICILAVLQSMLKTGPNHSSTSQPSLGSMSMLTTIPCEYPPLPNGLGFSMKVPASFGSIFTSSCLVKKGS